jgi:hypothetical protein
MGVTATETACQVRSRLEKTRRKRWSMTMRPSSSSSRRRPRLVPVPPTPPDVRAFRRAPLTNAVEIEVRDEHPFLRSRLHQGCSVHVESHGTRMKPKTAFSWLAATRWENSCVGTAPVSQFPPDASLRDCQKSDSQIGFGCALLSWE